MTVDRAGDDSTLPDELLSVHYGRTVPINDVYNPVLVSMVESEPGDIGEYPTGPQAAHSQPASRSARSSSRIWCSSSKRASGVVSPASVVPGTVWNAGFAVSRPAGASGAVAVCRASRNSWQRPWSALRAVTCVWPPVVEVVRPRASVRGTVPARSREWPASPPPRSPRAGAGACAHDTSGGQTSTVAIEGCACIDMSL